MQKDDDQDGADPASIKAMVSQLVDDTRSFAQAEVAYFRAEAGERAHHAVPGLAAIGAAIALLMGALIALLVGVMLWLSAALGPGLAILIVFAASLLLAFLAFKFGAARVRSATIARENRP